MNFADLLAFAIYLRTRAMVAVQQAMIAALHQIGAAVRALVMAHLGHYQPNVGAYPAWAPLAPATIERKTRLGHGLGGNPDTPLYATGRFHDEVEYVVDARGGAPGLQFMNNARTAVHIGTNLDYVRFLEYGTQNMPPRPVFGPAALMVVPHFLPQLHQFVAAGINGVIVSGLERRQPNLQYPAAGFAL